MTALQEILSKLKEYEHLYGCMYPQFKSWLKEGLEKEKQQIMEAWIEGRKPVYKTVPNFDLTNKGKDYFNSTYGNPQGDPETIK
jgi:hypothetical protein